MFWNREKKIQVELTAPITITQANCTDPQTPTSLAPVTKAIDKDFALKLLIGMALFLQAALFVDGYLELAAYFEQFGISTSELELTNPTILAAGYIHWFTMVMGWVDDMPIVGPFLQWFPFGTVALAYVYMLAHHESNGQSLVVKGLMGSFALFVIFILPTIGVRHGVDRGRHDIREAAGIEVVNGISQVHTIVTKEGESVTGYLVTADTKSAFLLANQTVYKIDNRTNRVTRKILLQAKTKKAL
ncbi:MULTISPECIES: hypothetical protein [unclassified Pseudomonas]|uniref:hypothetical protein n=1 Tax=unclassified Pseudomonas TaxID=196821 RepID=UPI000C884969|nr:MULTISPECIES: hypothetical protein [unclassified Pseudomonas]PNA02692.1 hypothetical protein C1X28_22860 [Pseudomonas sp. FW305-BF15]PNB78420.1 hypothetical protein C1X30_23535 [Pseudomonas sp. FW305-BF6]